VTDEIVERQNVAGIAEPLADLNHFRSGNDGFENLDDHAIRGQ
jgi:hypothetical protein